MPVSSVFGDYFRHYLNLGYSPLARFGNSWPPAWSDYCQRPAVGATLARWASTPDTMIAFACGYLNLVAIDVDTNDPDIKTEVLNVLPRCRVARFGSKGFALLTRYVGDGKCRFANIYTGEGAQKRPLIEIKGLGQNITVPPSIHLKTGQPYRWIDPVSGKPIDQPFDKAIGELPPITDVDLEDLRDAMLKRGWATLPRPAPTPRPGFDPAKVAKSRYEAWYRAGLTNARAALSRLGEGGGRPTALFKSICSLGAGVHHRFIPYLEFESAYLDACDANGLSSREGRHAILATIESGLRFSAEDELPDLGEEPVAARKKAAKNKSRANGSGGTDHHTICHDDTESPEQLGNGLDQEAEGAEEEDTRPVIDVKGDLHAVADRAEEVLFEAKAPIFHQAGNLVEPTRCSLVDNKAEVVHVPAISQVNSTNIRDALSRYARWEKWDGRAKKMVKVDPKPEVAQTLLARKGRGPHWRILAGVSASPMMRHDGTIAAKNGYDELSGWFLQDLPRMPPMPEYPDENDAREALEVLKPLLEEFPFIDSPFPDRAPKDTASYSVALSAILTLLARPMMNVAPGHAARAAEQGTGKTYLFNIASAIGLGTKCPVITQGEDKAETEKRLGALMMSGSQIICIDNVNTDLQSDLLCQVISEDLLQPRILGKSEHGKLINRFVVFVTGNNLSIIGDLNRRMLICEMDAVLEHPSERRFDHDPVAMIFQNRGRYIAAGLTIIRAHTLASFPGTAELSPLVSFDRWTDSVRGALVWLGLRDPVESMETLKKADPQRAEHAAFVTTFSELFAPDFAKHVTIGEIIEEASKTADDELKEARKHMKEILKDYGDRHGNISNRRVGKWLSRIVNRRFGDLRLRGDGEGKPMIKYWVERLP